MAKRFNFPGTEEYGYEEGYNDAMYIWREHMKHKSVGIHGFEKTVGRDEFDPSEHCSVCVEALKKREEG